MFGPTFALRLKRAVFSDSGAGDLRFFVAIAINAVVRYRPRAFTLGVLGKEATPIAAQQIFERSAFACFASAARFCFSR